MRTDAQRAASRIVREVLFEAARGEGPKAEMARAELADRHRAAYAAVSDAIRRTGEGLTAMGRVVARALAPFSALSEVAAAEEDRLRRETVERLANP